jgi:hypothetical protein
MQSLQTVSVGMTGNRPSANNSSNSLARKNNFQRDIPRAQETIYSFLLEIVKEWSPEEVLEEFKHLFIHHSNTISSATLPSLYEIVFANQEQEFRNALKRSCYILINNWDMSRNHKYIQELIKLFNDPIIYRQTVSPTLKRLRSWLQAFIESSDFEELQLFAARYDQEEIVHWSQRYTPYLLVAQYIDLNNPIEQRQAARALSRQLKEKFKFDLAMYTARSQTTIAKVDPPTNPTGFGDEVLRLIKIIVARRGIFSYPNMANIFINQTQNSSYRNFKKSLCRYLLFSLQDQTSAKSLQEQLAERLNILYVNHDDDPIDDALLLRTSNRVIEYLTTENHEEPSTLFITMLTQSDPLTLATILLKIILICPNARTHLEARIADLVKYYELLPEEECQWVVNFFEIFRISMAIYAENVEYNLVNMSRHYPLSKASHTSIKATPGNPLDAYRIFSQPRIHRPGQWDADLAELEQSLELDFKPKNGDDPSQSGEP